MLAVSITTIVAGDTIIISRNLGRHSKNRTYMCRVIIRTAILDLHTNRCGGVHEQCARDYNVRCDTPSSHAVRETDLEKVNILNTSLTAGSL